MWRETIKLRLAWSLLFILWGKFSAMVNHYAVEHDLQKYSRALCASVPLLYWKIMGLYPIKNCIKSLKYYMHFTGISLIRLFCMCRCWQHTEKGSSDWLLPFKSSSGAQDFFWIMKVCACMKNVQWKKKEIFFHQNHQSVRNSLWRLIILNIKHVYTHWKITLTENENHSISLSTFHLSLFKLRCQIIRFWVFVDILPKTIWYLNKNLHEWGWGWMLLISVISFGFVCIHRSPSVLILPSIGSDS